MDFTGKVVVISGAASGIGEACVREFAARRAAVAIVDCKAGAGEQTVAELRQKGATLKYFQADVGSRLEVERLIPLVVAQFGGIDVLVNNAGIGIHASFMETTEEQFDQLMNIHLKGTFFLTQKLLPLMKDGGRIVNLSSGLARFSLPGYAAYAAMKGGIEVLTRYMAKELGARRITVNAVAPGAIETDFGGGAVRDNKQINDFIASQTALGRVGLPDDIGGAVASLLSDDSGWINGQRVEVSGGVSL